MVEISFVIFFVIFLCMITCFLGGFAFFSLLEYLIDYFRCYVKYTSEQKLKLKEVMYYKDIPCGNDIFKNFCIALEAGIIENKETDFICAIFLKWLKEKKVSVGKIKKGILKTEYPCIFFKKSVIHEITNKHELMLYSDMFDASENGMFELIRFGKWCRRNTFRLYIWGRNILKEERRTLINSRGMYVIKHGKYIKSKKMQFSNRIFNEVIKLKGLKKYLKSHEFIEESEDIPIKLFEDYLIYAQLFGFGIDVITSFENLNLISESVYQSYEDLMFFMLVVKRGMASAELARFGGSGD